MSNPDVTTVQGMIDAGLIHRPIDGNHGSIHPKSTDYVPTGIPFVMATDLVDGRIDFEGCNYISEKQAKTLRKGFAKTGDVLLSHKATIGRTAIIQDNLFPFVMLTPQVTYYRVKDKTKLSPQYLKYVFDSHEFQTTMKSWAGDGSTRAYLGITAQHKLPVYLHDKNQQDRIVETIDPIIQKIEFNRRMNETLEDMAQAIFRDWFVDFGPVRRKASGVTDPVTIMGGLTVDTTHAAQLAALFPASLGNNDLPVGWAAKSLGDLIEPKKGRNITRKTVVLGDVPVVAGGLKPAYYHNLPNVSGPVITASASGANAGFIRLYHQDIWASDCSFISRDQTDHLFTFYALLSSRQDEIYKMQQGAAQPHIYPSDLKRLAVTDAPSTVWDASEQLFVPMFERIAHNELENRTLGEARDYLLPQLMSGAVRVTPQAEAA